MVDKDNTTVIYFAYGSNMCEGRLKSRCPSATVVSTATLTNHAFRWHKRSIDGSGKADAFETDDPADMIFGVVFEVARNEKQALDLAEGLGDGYDEKQVMVIDGTGIEWCAVTYVADPNYIAPSLKPYQWYRRFVIEGARQHSLPAEYVATISSVEVVEDLNQERAEANSRLRC